MHDVRILGLAEAKVADVQSGRLLVSASIPDTVKVEVASVDVTVVVTPLVAATTSFGQHTIGDVSATTILSADMNRLGCTIANTDASATLYLGFGSDPTAGTGFALGPGQSWTSPVAFSSDVRGISSSGSLVASHVNHSR